MLKFTCLHVNGNYLIEGSKMWWRQTRDAKEEIRSDQNAKKKKKWFLIFITYFLDDNSSADRVGLEPTKEPQSSDSNVKWASYGQNTQKI